MPVNAGQSVAASGSFAFDIDKDGQKRGADGTWDVGAFELH